MSTASLTRCCNHVAVFYERSAQVACASECRCTMAGCVANTPSAPQTGRQYLASPDHGAVVSS